MWFSTMMGFFFRQGPFFFLLLNLKKYTRIPLTSFLQEEGPQRDLRNFCPGLVFYDH